MKKCKTIFLPFFTLLVFLMFAGCESTDYIPIVQNGYLGEYTDMTVQDLLSGYYGNLLDEEIWDGGTTDDGKEIVQVTYKDTDGYIEDVTIQFTMLDEQCFELTAFIDPMEEFEQPTDLMAHLNYIYFTQYAIEHSEIAGDEEKELDFIKRLENIHASVVLFGAADEYEGDRSKLCEAAGDSPIDLSVVELLDTSGLIDASAYYADGAVETVQNGYLGEYTDVTVQELLFDHYNMALYDKEAWESSITDSGDKVVTVTYTDDRGEEEGVNIQFTMLDDECFKVTSFSDPLHPLKKSEDLMRILNYYYFEQYGAKHPEMIGTEEETKFIKSLERIDGFVVQYGASADYKGDRRKICEIAGDLPMEGTVVDVLQDSGMIDISAYYPTPPSEPDLAPVHSGYEKYYGLYEYGPAFITIDRGSDSDSLYVHVRFEPSAPWEPMHANVVPDEESYFAFYADNTPTNSDSIVADKDLIAGAVSIQEIGGTDYLILYKGQHDEDPYYVELTPQS